MLWFKHIANSTGDPELMSGIMRFGSDAYYVFFETLEVLTREEVFDAPKEFDFKFFKLFFPHISGPKLRRILEYFNNCRENAGEMPRISVEFKGEKIILFSDKHSRLSRSYAKKLGNQLEKNSSHRRKKKEERRKKEYTGAEKGPAPIDSQVINKDEKKKYGESVFMTDKEHSELLLKLKSEAKAKRAIEILDNYKVSKGRKYKNDYRAILSWVLDRLQEEISKGRFIPGGSSSNPLTERKIKIDFALEELFKKTYLSEQESWKVYNEETGQKLGRQNISDLELKYFSDFILKYYPKERGSNAKAES